MGTSFRELTYTEKAFYERVAVTTRSFLKKKKTMFNINKYYVRLDSPEEYFKIRNQLEQERRQKEEINRFIMLAPIIILGALILYHFENNKKVWYVRVCRNFKLKQLKNKRRKS